MGHDHKEVGPWRRRVSPFDAKGLKCTTTTTTGAAQHVTRQHRFQDDIELQTIVTMGDTLAKNLYTQPAFSH